jgi:hypothetical protein
MLAALLIALPLIVFFAALVLIFYLFPPIR